MPDAERYSLPMPALPILYDADCGFCRIMVAATLAWDRRGVLRPVALQDPAADPMLGDMPDDQRYRSWHLVLPGGEVCSGGQVFAPLLRVLPGGGPLARLPAAAPELTERVYRLVADHRTTWGALLPRATKVRAQERIDRRAARWVP